MSAPRLPASELERRERYLIDHQDQATEEQAEALGLSPYYVRDLRSKLVKAGKLPARKRGAGPGVVGPPGERIRLTPDEIDTMVRFHLKGGGSVPAVAKAAGVSKSWLWEQVEAYKERQHARQS